MEEINCCTVDGVDYLELDRIEYNSNQYVVLSNELNSEDFFIRKVTIEDGIEYYDGLKDEKEFETIINLFLDKHTKVIDIEE